MLIRKLVFCFRNCKKVTSGWNSGFVTRSFSVCNNILSEESNNIPNLKLRFPLIVKNLPKSVSLEDMNELMKKAGSVSDLRFLNDEDSTLDNFNCSLFYDDLESSLKAVNMFQNVSIGGSKISIELGSVEKTFTNVSNESDERTSSALSIENIPYRAGWQDLKDYMSSTGIRVLSVNFKAQSSETKVNVHNLITRQVVSAVVSFKNVKDATIAMHDFNNRKFFDHTLSIKYELLDNLYKDGVSPKPVSPTAANNTSTTIFVYNLVQDVTWMDLKDHFSLVGEVVVARVAPTGKKPFGHVQFATLEQANLALVQMQNTLLRGQPVYVCEVLDKSNKHKKQGMSTENSEEITFQQQRSDFDNRTDDNQHSNQITPVDANLVDSNEADKQYDDDKLLYMGDIPLDVYWTDLKALVSSTLGYEVGDVFLRLSADGSQQEALVEFETAEDARYACRKLQTLVIGDRALRVRAYDKEDSSTSGGEDEKRSAAIDM